MNNRNVFGNKLNSVWFYMFWNMMSPLKALV